MNVVIGAALVVALAGPTDDRPRLAVLDPVARGAPQEAALLVGDVLAKELAQSPRFVVVSRADVQAMVELDSTRSLLGCVGDDCVHDVASILDAPFVAGGTLLRTGRGYMLNVQIVDSRTATVEARASRESTHDEGALVDAARACARELLHLPARVQLWPQVPGARVFVDDLLVGEMPLAPFPVQGKEHVEVRVSHPDYPDSAVRVAVVAGRTSRARLDMLSYAEIEQRAAWRVGVSVVGLVGAAVVGSVAALALWHGYETAGEYQSANNRIVTQAQLDDLAAESTTSLNAGYGGAAVAVVGAALATAGLIVDPDAGRVAQ
jgi:hypothetical protein